MGLVIGSDNFGEIVKNHFDFVDKSLFIKEILDNASAKVELITRPRRFGKTLNLSMLHHFLASEVYGQKTQGLFDGLKITQTDKRYMQQQGQYPVIFVTFKDVKDSRFEIAYKKLCILMQEVYIQHHYLLSSPKLHEEDKEAFRMVLRGKIEDQASLEMSLKNLTRYLSEHHGINPWVLIDEYDTPIQASYISDYYDDMIGMMRGLLGSVLKSNPFLNKAVITGILRIAKESLFSGLNNLRVYSILNSTYGQYFGFTENEVIDLLKQAKLEDRFDEIKSWYDGYYVGDINVYNPWSIVNSIEDRQCKAYWVNTGDTTLIKDRFIQSSVDTKTKLETIILGQSIEVSIDENIVFKELSESTETIWNLLLFSGYLKSSYCEDEEFGLRCLLASPNREVTRLYKKMVREWFVDRLSESKYNEFLKDLIEGRIERFSETLKRFLMESFSVFDTEERSPEKFYHGFVMGLVVSLNETHIIKSNRESGLGRYDVMMIPKDRKNLGLILEFKVAKDTEIDLKESAKEALHQIEERQYEAELKQNGIDRILKLGLAFRGKEVSIQEERNI